MDLNEPGRLGVPKLLEKLTHHLFIIFGRGNDDMVHAALRRIAAVDPDVAATVAVARDTEGLVARLQALSGQEAQV